ncbi:MAG TPA: hypothetical protein VGT44_05560 [Ktedonobacteraceae bacterium]|nr:hypothetical protein [Ktedonobacteraceae bacterium]
MQRNGKWFVFLMLTLAILLASTFAASFVFARGTGSPASAGADASAQAATAPLVGMHTITMSNIPAATRSSSGSRAEGDSMYRGVDPAVYAQRKAAAAHNPNAPLNAHPVQAVRAANLPAVINQFNGLADSSANCPIFGSCRHPDMALAASSSWVLQGVNEAWSVYDTSGTVQSGWPKNYQQFFGVPNPPNHCDTLPYMVDVRAFYDPADGRFWAAMLQDEGAYGYNNCPFQALYWIAVSATSNPTGAWHIYTFDMAQGTTFPVDFTQLGFNGSAVYFSGNLLNLSGSTFEYAEVFAASKSLMESGSTVTAKGFKKLKASNTLVDSVQPVETQALGSSAPTAELLVSSFNVKSGGGSCSKGCSGVVAWAFANALKTPSLSKVVVSTPTYTLPPYADQPGCSHCIETFDTRIGATPVYNNGKISFALESGVNNGTQVVPGVFWGQITPTLSSAGKITGATLFQSGIFSFTGDQAASYGAVMDDSQDSVFLAFATMSHTIKPGDMYTVHLTTDTKGTMETPAYLIQGQAAKTTQYYGDYQATSYDGSSGNHTWFATEYVNAGGDWSTFIADV